LYEDTNFELTFVSISLDWENLQQLVSHGLKVLSWPPCHRARALRVQISSDKTSSTSYWRCWTSELWSTL